MIVYIKVLAQPLIIASTEVDKLFALALVLCPVGLLTSFAAVTECTANRAQFLDMVSFSLADSANSRPLLSGQRFNYPVDKEGLLRQEQLHRRRGGSQSGFGHLDAAYSLYICLINEQNSNAAFWDLGQASQNSTMIVTISLD